eukprot:scaffold922_cov327-Pinguiococcus_pyrenoidosus.AAC.8
MTSCAACLGCFCALYGWLYALRSLQRRCYAKAYGSILRGSRGSVPSVFSVLPRGACAFRAAWRLWGLPVREIMEELLAPALLLIRFQGVDCLLPARFPLRDGDDIAALAGIVVPENALADLRVQIASLCGLLPSAVVEVLGSPSAEGERGRINLGRLRRSGGGLLFGFLLLFVLADIYVRDGLPGGEHPGPSSDSMRKLGDCVANAGQQGLLHHGPDAINHQSQR